MTANAEENPLANTNQEDTPQDATYAQLAQQQVQCLVYGGMAHPGTTTDDEFQLLFDGAIESLTHYVERARSGNFQGSEKVPMYMMMDGLPTLGSTEFAVGRIFETIRSYEADSITKYGGLFPDDPVDKFGEWVPHEKWPDRASIMFSKDGCRAVAQSQMQCLSRFGCVKTQGE
jgi:hypothetical protein